MRVFLWPFSVGFDFFITLRRWLYQKKFFKQIKLIKPVISVGNLTVGGTGKTPFVDYLLNLSEARNFNTAVLTRGYGRHSNKTFLVSETSKVSEVGDEPYWLWRRHPRAQILVSRERASQGEKLGDVDFFILDDGRQHLKLFSNVDVTLIDATRPLNHYFLLPLGRAREKWQTLKRSDLIILTRSNLQTPANISNLVNAVKATGYRGEIVRSKMRVRGVRAISQRPSQKMKNLFLTSAIGNPESFSALVSQDLPEYKIGGQKFFPDHHFYTGADLENIFELAKAARADTVLITEKDEAKWQGLLKENIQTDFSICVLETELTFEPKLPDLYDLALSKNS